MARHQHILINTPGDSRRYKHVSTGGGGDPYVVPARPSRVDHGNRLQAEIVEVSQSLKASADAAGHEIADICLEIVGETRDLQIQSLESFKRNEQFELRTVVETDGKAYATVFVPEQGLQSFVKRFEKYVHENHPKSGKPWHHDFVAGIGEIRTPVLRSFWTDTDELFPTDDSTPIWWEVWLQVRSSDDQDAAFVEFATTVAASGLRVGPHPLVFPERIVFHVHGTVREWTSVFVPLLDRLAELRKAKEVAGEFFKLDGELQRGLIDDLIGRLTPPDSECPVVCILDYGASAEHPLLAPFLSTMDQHTVMPDWTKVDTREHHGTEMAGLAIFGHELPILLGGTANPYTPHRLESVRLLNSASPNPEVTWGWLTQDAVAIAEQHAPDRLRVVLLPVTSNGEGRDRGLPTSWSAAIDQSAAGALDETKRLYVVSAGNIWTVTTDANYTYPDDNLYQHRIEDPAQSWNALTVGACTDLIQIRSEEHEGFTVLANHGELCPTSRTSVSWEDGDLPIKPDIVLEGGNYARAPDGTIHGIDDLTLLTTSIEQFGKPLTWMSDTSAASAQAARMAAMLQSEYPTLWPETIRGLLVHSARWTEGMENQLKAKSKGNLETRLRCFGYGKPNLDAARFTLNNQVSLVHQGAIQPFHLEGNDAKTKEYHFHDLPWPRDVLADLHEQSVRLRITLSYFIEPNPTHRGWSGKFRYQSHGLRFKVKGPAELDENFLRRVSAAEEWDKDTRGKPDLSDPIPWTLGSNRQTKGSLHSDWWDTTGSALAACGQIAVHPVTGWWKERPHLDCVTKLTRYSLIVTLETKESNVDLYTPIINQITPTINIDI